MPLVSILGRKDFWASTTVFSQEPVLSPTLSSPVQCWRFIHMVKVNNIKVKLSQSIRQSSDQLSQRYGSASNPEKFPTLHFRTPLFVCMYVCVCGCVCKHVHLMCCLILLIEEILLFPNKHFKTGCILQEDVVTGCCGASPLFTWRCFLLAWYSPFPGLIFCLVHVANHSINRKDTWKII